MREGVAYRGDGVGGINMLAPLLGRVGVCGRDEEGRLGDNSSDGRVGKNGLRD